MQNPLGLECCDTSHVMPKLFARENGQHVSIFFKKRLKVVKDGLKLTFERPVFCMLLDSRF